MKLLALMSLVGAISLSAVAIAQTPSKVPPKPAEAAKPDSAKPDSAKPDSAKPDPAKDAFMAIPEDDRKAAQDALVWLGLYNGLTDGAWGKRTGDAIGAYEKSLNQKPDGMLAPAQLAALKAAGAKARDAAGFQVFVDAASGVQIGAPIKLLSKTSTEPDRSVRASRDGDVRLEISVVRPAGDGAPVLESLFKSIATDGDGRKIAYKAMKVGAFFVVSGEENASKFYARYALAPDGTARGFVFRYPKAKADAYDKIAIAISNAFDVNPAKKSVPLPPSPPSPVASAPPAPPVPQLIATAFVLAPGQALTALTPAECQNPLVAGKPATFGRVDESSGLARLDGDFGAGATPASLGADTADAYVLSRAPGPGEKSVVELGRGEWARLTGSEGRVIVSATASARGAPVFSLQGDMLGVLAPAKTPPRKFAGVAVANPQRALAGPALANFVSAGTGASGPLSAPELARRFAARVLAVTCGA